MLSSVRRKKAVWKDHIEMVMNDGNDWDHDVEGDAVEGPVDRVSRDEVVQVLNETKTVSFDVPLELIAASKEIGI